MSFDAISYTDVASGIVTSGLGWTFVFPEVYFPILVNPLRKVLGGGVKVF